MSEIQRGRTDLAVQAEDPVHPQPEPEGCTQLWPFPTSLQRQSGQVSGWGAAAKRIPLPFPRSCALSGGEDGCMTVRLYGGLTAGREEVVFFNYPIQWCLGWSGWYCSFTPPPRFVFSRCASHSSCTNAQCCVLRRRAVWSCSHLSLIIAALVRPFCLLAFFLRELTDINKRQSKGSRLSSLFPRVLRCITGMRNLILWFILHSEPQFNVPWCTGGYWDCH